MIKLNDNNIIVGQIKQILNTFNLPGCRVGKDKTLDGHVYINAESSTICRNVKNREEIVCAYNFGDQINNLTNNFSIHNMIYDKETHFYFGNYLRFLRDYKKINLMSMYNCNCDDPLTTNINLTNCAFSLDGTDQYIIFKVPVSITEFTICTHSWIPIDICLTVNPDEIGTKITENTDAAKLIRQTSRKIVADKPIIYDPIKSITDKSLLYKNFEKLVLLVKVPKAFSKSIVILEGEYTNYISSDSALITFRNSKDNSLSTSKFEVSSQLLSSNNITNRLNLLGDRIVEYLVSNVIGPISSNAEISGVQKMLEKLPSFISYEGNERKYITIDNIKNWGRYRARGIWHPLDDVSMKRLIYNDKLFENYDTLGYYDKDIEHITKDIFDESL